MAFAGFPRFRHQFIAGLAFLLIDVQQLLSEDLIGQRGLDLPYPIFGQVCLIRLCRPRHHVDVRMVTLIVEGRVPTKILQWDLHRCGDVVAVGAEQCAPCVRMVIPQPLRILPVEGDDVRPHIAGVVIQFVCNSGEVNGIVITEQTVFPQPFRSGPQGDVLGVALGGREPVPIRFQRQRNERGRGCFGWVRRVVLVLHQLFCVRKILHQFCDELLLLACRWTVIRDDLHPLPCGDVLEVPASALPSAALDVRAFDDQPCHASLSSSRSFCSNRS